MLYGGIFDFDNKSERLTEVLRELEDPSVWEDREKAQALGRERGQLEAVVDTISELDQVLLDSIELLELAVEEDDHETVATVVQDLEAYEEKSCQIGIPTYVSGGNGS